ncbi:hypothetical protein [Streptomyces geysiriensis]|uniref:hypothetical protein n=1 Tax=Streptomyces geysiriensis TaxID=68207 RepID=UPI002176C538|nr:hypothetical protein [Streptomyces geysiriensis]
MPDTTPLAPMTPHAAISAFNYLRAVQAYDIDTAREFTGAGPRMPELARRRAECIVVPVTALPGPKAGERCEDRPGGRLRDLAADLGGQAGPDTAECIARAVIDFA